MSNFNLYQRKEFYSDLNLAENLKNRNAFIKNIESIIRNSFEYRKFIHYLKKEAKLSYCSLMGNLSEEFYNKISIEMHHHPVTLYDLVDTVLNKTLKEEREFTKFSIANEVMELHFNLKIGIVPLTTTAHQLAHSDSMVIEIKDIHGDFFSFIEEYEEFFSEEVTGRITKHLENAENTLLAREKNKLMLTINENLFNEKTENFIEEIEKDFL